MCSSDLTGTKIISLYLQYITCLCLIYTHQYIFIQYIEGLYVWRSWSSLVFGADLSVIWTGLDPTGRHLHSCFRTSTCGLGPGRGTDVSLTMGGAEAGRPSSSFHSHQSEWTLLFTFRTLCRRTVRLPMSPDPPCRSRLIRCRAAPAAPAPSSRTAGSGSLRSGARR